MYCLFNRDTKLLIGSQLRAPIEINPITEVQLELIVKPNSVTDRLNDTEDGVRPATQAELDAAIDMEKTTTSDFEMRFEPLLKAFALVVMDELNILRGQHALADRTPSQIKAAIKAKLP